MFFFFKKMHEVKKRDSEINTVNGQVEGGKGIIIISGNNNNVFKGLKLGVVHGLREGKNGGLVFDKRGRGGEGSDREG